jgi:type IV secretion system protein VirD4
VRAVGPLLLKRGYVLRVFDLVDPAHSDCYNPFRYIRKDADVFRLIDNLIKNTTPKNAANNDPFWESATRSLAVKSQRTNNKIPLFGYLKWRFSENNQTKNS